MHAKQPICPIPRTEVSAFGKETQTYHGSSGITVEDLAFLFAWNGLIARGESPKGAFTKAGAYIDELGLK